METNLLNNMQAFAVCQGQEVAITHGSNLDKTLVGEVIIIEEQRRISLGRTVKVAVLGSTEKGMDPIQGHWGSLLGKHWIQVLVRVAHHTPLRGFYLDGKSLSPEPTFSAFQFFDKRDPVCWLLCAFYNRLQL